LICLVVCVIIVTLSNIKFHLTKIRHAAFGRALRSVCSVLMLKIVFLEILHKDIIVLVWFRFRRHFDLIWYSFTSMHFADLIDASISILFLAYTAANKVNYEG